VVARSRPPCGRGDHALAKRPSRPPREHVRAAGSADSEAAGLLARFLSGQSGHHRITTDPAAADGQGVPGDAEVGFRPVGVMRQYERAATAAP
jgi:hypothetical protein